MQNGLSKGLTLPDGVQGYAERLALFVAKRSALLQADNGAGKIDAERTKRGLDLARRRTGVRRAARFVRSEALCAIFTSHKKR